MKRNLIVVAALALLAIPVISSAEPARPGAYVSGFLGVNVLQNTDVTNTNFTNNAVLLDRVEFDPSINIGGTGGYNFGYFRLEGELSYKHGEISSVRDSAGSTFVDTDGSLGALALMANGFFDLRNDSPITPYFGGGVGFATLHLSDTNGTQRGTGQRLRLYDEDNDTVFPYQAGAGMEIALNRRLSLDVGYRYFATDVARFDNGGLLETKLKFQSHSGTVGVRVKF